MATITESFNKANSPTLGPDLTWTELVGNIDVVSNKAQSVTVDADVVARADSDLATVDHYAEATVDASIATAAYPGVIIRKDATATVTYYSAFAQFTEDLVTLRKTIAGAITDLLSVPHVFNAGTPVTIRLEGVGSNIRVLVDGVEKISVSDSSINTGKRTGLYGFKGASSGFLTWENFGAGDIAAHTSPGFDFARRRVRFFFDDDEDEENEI